MSAGQRGPPRFPKLSRDQHGVAHGTGGAAQDVQGDDAAIEPAVAALDVAGVALDSRMVKPGDLFFALAGSKTDGARFIDAAIAESRAARARDPANAELRRLFAAASRQKVDLLQWVTRVAAS